MTIGDIYSELFNVSVKLNFLSKVLREGEITGEGCEAGLAKIVEGINGDLKSLMARIVKQGAIEKA